MSRLRGSHAGLSPSPTRAPERAEQEEPETGDRITLDSGRVVTLAIDWSNQFGWLAIDDQTYDYDPDPVGAGETRQAAVDDLLEQIGDEK
jgi:hypothetical protein